MSSAPDHAGQHGTTPGARWRVELNLTVWSAGDGWHAALVCPEGGLREFASPFELARYLSWPLAGLPANTSNGLR